MLWRTSVWIVAIVCILLCGCTLLEEMSKEAREKMDGLETGIENVVEELKATGESISRTIAQKDEVLGLIKKGELTPEKAIELLRVLEEDAQRYVKHYQVLLQQKESLITDYKSLQNEHGIPWWRIVGELALSAVLAYLGLKNITLKDGIDLFVRSVEKGGTAKEIKARISKGNNSAVERAVLKLPVIPNNHPIVK